MASASIANDKDNDNDDELHAGATLCQRPATLAEIIRRIRYIDSCCISKLDPNRDVVKNSQTWCQTLNHVIRNPSNDKPLKVDRSIRPAEAG